MTEEFCKYIDEWISQIDKKQNSFNADDLRFIAFKGKQQTLKDVLKIIDDWYNKTEWELSYVSLTDLNKLKNRIKELEEEK